MYTILFIISLFINISYLLSASSGKIPYCNLGTSSTLYRGYGRGSSVMPWVKPATNTTYYTLRTGDNNILNDVTYYTPDKYTPIHIRTLDLDRKFIGLILYAVDNKNNQVGTWSIPNGIQFQITPNCNNHTITHSDADLKPLHIIFYFTAPKGTGTITFRIMIKQGEQGKGNFFYPMKNLTLTEGSVLNTTAIVGTSGLSCNSVCATKNLACDPDSSNLINSQLALSNLTFNQQPCRLPLVAGTSNFIPAMSTDGFCYYKTQNTSNPNYKAFSCSDAETNIPRACVCKIGTVINDLPARVATLEPSPSSFPTDPPSTPSPFVSKKMVRVAVLIVKKGIPVNFTETTFSSYIASAIGKAIIANPSRVAIISLSVGAANLVTVKFAFLPPSNDDDASEQACMTSYVGQIFYTKSPLIIQKYMTNIDTINSMSATSSSANTYVLALNCGDYWTLDPTCDVAFTRSLATGAGIAIAVLVFIIFVAWIYKRYKTQEASEEEEHVQLQDVTLNVNQSSISPSPLMNSSFNTHLSIIPNVPFQNKSRPLPAGWSQHYDEQGQAYYFNESTGVSSWDRPN